MNTERPSLLRLVINGLLILLLAMASFGLGIGLGIGLTMTTLAMFGVVKELPFQEAITNTFMIEILLLAEDGGFFMSVVANMSRALVWMILTLLAWWALYWLRRKVSPAKLKEAIDTLGQ